MVGIPTNSIDNSTRIFVDPFHDGQILTYADCQVIVGRYNMTFHDDMVKPISNEEVWQRMVRNLIHSHSMQALAEDNESGPGTNQEWKIAIRKFGHSLFRLCSVPYIMPLNYHTICA